MTKKKKVACWVDGQLANELDRLAGRYAGNKGDLLAAALHLFMNAPKVDQAASLKAALGIRVDLLFDLDAADGQAAASRRPDVRPRLRKPSKLSTRK